MTKTRLETRKRGTYDIDDISTNYHFRFVSASNNGPRDDLHEQNGPSANKHLSGLEVRSIYEEIVNSPCTSSHDQGNHNGRRAVKKLKLTKEKSKQNQRSNRILDLQTIKKIIAKILKLCNHDGNIKELSELLDDIRDNHNYSTILNATDQYGWSALMCAAAEGCIEIVKKLVTEGATYQNLTDKGGCSILDICDRRQQFVVKDYLVREASTMQQNQQNCKAIKSKQNKCDKDTTENEFVECLLCGVTYKSHTFKEHASSMVHIFNDNTRHVAPSHSRTISNKNIGFQMMLRSGWSVDKGLGPSGLGRKNPIKTVLKNDRTGLGLIEKREERISHFGAFDESAVDKLKRWPKRQRHDEDSGRKKVHDSRHYSCNASKLRYKHEKNKQWERNIRRYMSSDD